MKFAIIAFTFVSLLPVTGFAVEADVSSFSNEKCRDILLDQADRRIRSYEAREADRIVPNHSSSMVSAAKIEMLEQEKEKARISDSPCKIVKELHLDADDSLITGEREEETAPFSR